MFEDKSDIDRQIARRRHSARILARDDDGLVRLVEEELAKPLPKEPEPEEATA